MSTPLRVAVVTTFPPDRGNLAEYGFHLVEALRQTPGVAHVDVIANVCPSTAELETPFDNVTIHRMWQLDDGVSIQSLALKLREIKPDVVHINAGIRTWGKGRGASMAGAALGYSLRLMGYKVITTVHTIGDTVALGHLKIDRFTKWGMNLASWLYTRAHGVTVTLPSMQAALRKRFNVTNVHCVAHGTYGTRVDSVPKVDKMRLLAFGFWGALKDADLLVNATRTLRSKGMDAEVVLGGGPHPYFPQFYERTKEKYQALPYVHFTGYVPEAKLGELFTSAACVVMPYHTNAGASGVLNLIRSYGRPVVISNEPALLEQIRLEGGGAYVFQGEEGLVKALESLFASKEEQYRLGEANLNVARHVTLRTQAVRFLEIYKAVINGNYEAKFDPNQEGLNTRLEMANGETRLVGPPRVEASAA